MGPGPVQALDELPGVRSALADVRAAWRLQSEGAALHMAERAAEQGDDEAALLAAVAAIDAWRERTRAERERLWGPRGWPW